MGIIHTAPRPGDPHLGRTLPSLAYEGARKYANPRLFGRPEGEGWKYYSADEFCDLSEALGLGLLDLGLTRGDRVGMYMYSDVNFCVADMGCLIAGLVDVPVYLSHEPEAASYVLEHSGSKALIVSNQDQFDAIWPAISKLDQLRFVVVVRSADIGMVAAHSERVAIHSLDEVLDRGRAVRAADGETVSRLLDQVQPDDLATIIYTSGTTGRPKGVMLTHENISSNGLTSFSELDGYRRGPDGETGISFLPLTHVFARTLHYGFLAYGTTNHFVEPLELADRLLEVRPTIFAAVPRVLEKVYGNIRAKSQLVTGLKQKLAFWALDLAEENRLGHKMPLTYRLKHAVADRIVYSKWRAALGGRVGYVICGGAALNADLANIFGAAGVNVLQGYGLTETSPVITFNRPGRNRAGTVGEPIPGVEVTIAEDGEVLTRGPHVMVGYYRDEEKTGEVIDPDGWFHTGDIGHFNDEGRLVITDRKKDLFKLSTGKYIAPQPLENKLNKSDLIDQVVILGPGRKFCGALIFVNVEAVRNLGRRYAIETEDEDELLRHHRIVSVFQSLIDEANRGLHHWETVKQFRLLHADVSVESGLLTPTLKVKRREVTERYADVIEALYTESNQVDGGP
ncbi:MAG: long-chain fatty acid--CoA ligase [Rhodothermia bacterium]|nr:long-chain fatty acid--CoA ligase [Rhodothermia bacterium]